MKKSLILSAILALTLAVGTANAVVTELVLNGGLENWTGGVPDSWDMTNRSSGDPSVPTPGEVNPSPSYTISEQTTELRAGTPGTKALKCTRTASDYTYRYYAFTNQIEPVVAGTDASFDGYLKGLSGRAYLAYSTDNGVSWFVLNTANFGGHTGTESWARVTQTLTNMNDPTRKYKIAFHSFLAGDVLIDDISLIGDDGTAPPLSVAKMDPPVRYYLTRTQKITATPQGGNGNFTQVQFDIGNNGTIDGTDTTAPFEYVWNTQATQAAKGVVPVRVIVTDSTLATGETIFNYTVDNRFAGREELITNGGFDAWQTENPNLPVDWVENLPLSASATYGKEELDCPPDGLSTPSLQVTYSAFDATVRNTLRHIGKQNVGGIYEDHQVAYWGKGINCSMQYYKSVDGGTTWENANEVAAAVGVAGWLYSIGIVQPLVAANLYEYTTIATANVQFKAIYDNISWKATFIPFIAPAGVTGSWDIYE